MDNIKKVQPINFQIENKKPAQKKQKKAKKEQIYTILYYSDIIQLLIDYQIPVAQQTLDALKSNTAYIIKRELETIKK